MIICAFAAFPVIHLKTLKPHGEIAFPLGLPYIVDLAYCMVVGILQEKVKSAPSDVAFSRRFWRTYGEEKYLRYKAPAIVEHLAFLSVKHGVSLADLYQAIVLARAAGKSVLEELSLEYRCSIRDEAVFLITKGSKVVVQFRIAESYLSRKDVCFDSWMDTDKIRKQLSRQNIDSSHSILIQNLRHGMKKVNLEAEILETQKPKLIRTQYGNNILVTNAVIGDETGKVKLSLWGEQSNSAVVGDIVQIKNASVRIFKGERQVSIGRNGTISVKQNMTEEQQAILARP